MRKKLVLINPINPSELSKIKIVPTQLLILASYIKKNLDLDVDILDLSFKFEFHSVDKTISRYLDKFNDYDYFGIACFSSFFYMTSLFLAKKIREILPNAYIFVGGYHPTIRPNDFVFPNSPFNYIFSGEAEKELCKLIKKLNVKSFRLKAPLIIYCEPLNIEDFINTDWSYTESLDYVKNPTPSDRVMIPVFLSRGCPFTCNFCQDPKNKLTKASRSWRRMPINKALNELVNIYNQFHNRDNLIYEVWIWDPLFGTPKYRIELYKKLLRYAPDQYYWAELRVDTFKPDEEIPFLKQLKFSLTFGLESGSPKILKICMNKTPKPYKYLEKMKVISKKLDENEIYHTINILYGHPGETYQTINETNDYLVKLFKNKHFILPNYSIYEHYPGTEIYSNMSKYENLYGTQFLLKKWWNTKKNPKMASRLIKPSNELDCIDVHYKTQENVLNIAKIVLKNKIGRRSDMPLTYHKIREYLINGIMTWKMVPKFFINLIRDNIFVLLANNYSKEMYNFMKNKIDKLLAEDFPQKFKTIEFLKTNFPEFL